MDCPARAKPVVHDARPLSLALPAGRARPKAACKKAAPQEFVHRRLMRHRAGRIITLRLEAIPTLGGLLSGAIPT